eukprot:4070421-Amphidinium_carterae.2
MICKAACWERNAGTAPSLRHPRGCRGTTLSRHASQHEQAPNRPLKFTLSAEERFYDSPK